MNTVVNMSSTHPSPDTDGRPPGQAATPAPSDTRATAQAERYRHRPGSNAQVAATPATHSPFISLLLSGLALLGWLGFQTQQLLAERDALAAAHASQQQTVDNAGKLRTSLDALAADTQSMALAGNLSAKVLVDELAQRGVTINTPTNAPVAPATPPLPPKH